MDVQEIARREAEAAAKKDSSFAKFMVDSNTKLLVSLIPKSEPPEALETLIRQAFDAGYSGGQGEALALVVDAMFRAPLKGDDWR